MTSDGNRLSGEGRDMGIKKIQTPLADDVIQSLKAGEKVLLSGFIYTARDAAHKRMSDALARGEQLKVDLSGAVLFYAGPSPARPGEPMGSIGPTTSYRMDPFTPLFLELGMKGMIGKGERSSEVVEKKRSGLPRSHRRYCRPACADNSLFPGPRLRRPGA